MPRRPPELAPITREPGEAWMAEPMTLNAIMNSHITHTADAARALAQPSLDECILSLNLETELK